MWACLWSRRAMAANVVLTLCEQGRGNLGRCRGDAGVMEAMRAPALLGRCFHALSGKRLGSPTSPGQSQAVRVICHNTIGNCFCIGTALAKMHIRLFPSSSAPLYWIRHLVDARFVNADINHTVLRVGTEQHIKTVNLQSWRTVHNTSRFQI